jgi:transcriptional regulator with XRE-family HTH domain
MYEIYERLREARGLSDYAVAAQTGIARSILSEWKAGKHQPGIKNLLILANFFGVTVDYLIGNSQKAIM